MARRKGTFESRSACEIKTLSNKLIGSGYIRSMDENTVEIINKEDELPLLRLNTVVRMHIFSAELDLQILVGTVFISTRRFMRVVGVESVTRYEKRGFFRIVADLIGWCSSCEAEGEKKEDKPETPASLFPVRVVDISLSGFLMVCIKPEDQLQVGQTLNIQLPIHEMESIRFHVHRIQDQPHTVSYGCRFLEMNDRQIEVLCRFIFQKQREQIKAMKGFGANVIKET